MMDLVTDGGTTQMIIRLQGGTRRWKKSQEGRKRKRQELRKITQSDLGERRPPEEGGLAPPQRLTWRKVAHASRPRRGETNGVPVTGYRWWFNPRCSGTPSNVCDRSVSREDVLSSVRVVQELLHVGSVARRCAR